MKEEASPKVKGSRAKTGDGPRGFASPDPKITEGDNAVKHDFSREFNLDSEGRELTEGQQEYFKGSKVRDEDGNLLVVYHGTFHQGR